MIVNTANSALMAELATHVKLIKRKKHDNPAKERQKSRKSDKGPNNGLHAVKAKMSRMAGLTQNEIEKAVEVRLIDRDQAWNWIPSSMDGLREGLRDIEKGRQIGPFGDVDELVASLMENHKKALSE